MSIRRACSYSAAFTLPDDALSYTALLVTVSQNRKQIINKEMDQLALAGRVATLRLTQEETLLLSADYPAQLQIRAYKGAYDAPGSRIFTVDVNPSLNEEVLP